LSQIEETTQKLLRSSDRRTEVSIESSSLAIRFEAVAMDAAVAGVGPLGTLTYNAEVDLAGVLEWGVLFLVPPDGAQVDVLIQL